MSKTVALAIFVGIGDWMVQEISLSSFGYWCKSGLNQYRLNIIFCWLFNGLYEMNLVSVQLPVGRYPHH